MSPQGGGPQRKQETSSSHATADPLTGNRRRKGTHASRRCARAISVERQRRGCTLRSRITNGLNRKDDGTAGVCACGCQKINRRSCRRLRAGDIERQEIGRDLQRRAAAERRHDGHTATRRFGGGSAPGDNQQACYDTDREQVTHIAGDHDRRWRRGDLLGLERRLSLRLLRTAEAFARQEHLLWRAIPYRFSAAPITVRVSEVSFRCAKIEPLRVRVGTV